MMIMIMMMMMMMMIMTLMMMMTTGQACHGDDDEYDIGNTANRIFFSS